jgi:hypothetical protein
MPIEVAYLPSEALNSRPHAAAATIRAVAAQVRRQIPREPDSLALTFPALIDAFIRRFNVEEGKRVVGAAQDTLACLMAFLVNVAFLKVVLLGW